MTAILAAGNPWHYLNPKYFLFILVYLSWCQRRLKNTSKRHELNTRDSNTRNYFKNFGLNTLDETKRSIRNKRILLKSFIFVWYFWWMKKCDNYSLLIILEKFFFPIKRKQGVNNCFKLLISSVFTTVASD